MENLFLYISAYKTSFLRQNVIKSTFNIQAKQFAETLYTIIPL